MSYICLDRLNNMIDGHLDISNLGLTSLDFMLNHPKFSKMTLKKLIAQIIN